MGIVLYTLLVMVLTSALCGIINRHNRVGIMFVDESKEEREKYSLLVTKDPDIWKKNKYIVFRVKGVDNLKDKQ